jgi:hypothetical protein
MNSSVRWYGVLLLAMIMGISGCCARLPDYKVVTDARLYFELINKQVPDEECNNYKDNRIKKACEQLKDAEKALREDREADAVLAAQKSIKASFRKLLDENLNIREHQR